MIIDGQIPAPQQKRTLVLKNPYKEEKYFKSTAACSKVIAEGDKENIAPPDRYNG